MDEARREALKDYCHLDDLSAGEERQLEAFYLGACAYLDGAGIERPADRAGQSLYDLVVNALVNDAWDNRRSTVTGQLFENPVWQRMKNQLKFDGLAAEVRA